MATVKVYGADWCSPTTRTREHLDELGVKYEYIDVDDNPQASEWVKQQNNGKEKKPTLDIDGEVLTNPSYRELEAVLRDKNFLG